MPNGNREYYTGRSQPPFLALMVECIYNHLKQREEKGEGEGEGDRKGGLSLVFLRRALPSLDAEYAYFMTVTAFDECLTFDTTTPCCCQSSPHPLRASTIVFSHCASLLTQRDSLGGTAHG